MVYVTRGYCSNCDIYFKWGHRQKKMNCPKCEKEAKCKAIPKSTPLYYQAKPKGERCNWDSQHIDNERWSDAMGINPDQREEFGKAFPWMEFDREGRCRVGSRQEKKKIMKARGMVEFD